MSKTKRVTYRLTIDVNELGEKQNTLRNRMIFLLDHYSMIESRMKEFYGIKADEPIKDGEVLAHLMGINFEDCMRESAYEIHWNNHKRFAMISLPSTCSTDREVCIICPNKDTTHCIGCTSTNQP